jgi:hypothetical protein
VRAQIAWKMSFTSGQAPWAAAGHHGRAEARAFLAARNARADIQQAFALEIFGAADGVGEMRIAAVDDHVAGFQVRQHQLDEFVHRLAPGFTISMTLRGRFSRPAISSMEWAPMTFLRPWRRRSESRRLWKRCD